MKTVDFIKQLYSLVQCIKYSQTLKAVTDCKAVWFSF